jgi:hypothetical protein
MIKRLWYKHHQIFESPLQMSPIHSAIKGLLGSYSTCDFNVQGKHRAGTLRLTYFLRVQSAVNKQAKTPLRCCSEIQVRKRAAAYEYAYD